MSDHHDPDITAEFWGPEKRRRPPRPQRELSLHSLSPLSRRLAALAAVGLLMVPVAIALRSPQAPTPVAFADSREADSQDAQSRDSRIDSEIVIVTVSSLPTADADADAVGEESQIATEGSVRMMNLPILNTPAELKELRRREVCSRTYRVHAGDSWLRIAAAGQIAVAQLLSVNDAQLDTSIHPGQELCLPAGARMPSPPTTTVASAPPVRAVAPSPVRTPAPPTRVVAPAGPRPSPDQVIAMIREIWPAELQERAIAIAHRESRHRADAYNGWCCYGVFQIYWNVHRSWMSGHGVASASQLFDARTNIEMAYRIYQRAGGWGPWT
jgi:LysM repeat protein